MVAPGGVTSVVEETPAPRERQPVDAVCLICRRPGLSLVAETGPLPVLSNVLWPTAAEARAARRGDIRLAFCSGCGAIRNLAFDPDLIGYDEGYDNSLHFSPSFQAFATNLARRLVETHQLQGRTVVEIGAGKGDFLSLLCAAGAGRGVGYDPSYAGESDHASGQLTFVRERYPESQGPMGTDLGLICCRHVLEHLDRPDELVDGLARSMAGSEGAVVYLEVPDASYMLRTLAVWDVIYEHPWYFSGPTLRRLFHDAGFAVLAVGSTFGGQYLFVETRPSLTALPVPEASEEIGGLAVLADRFAAGYREALAAWAEGLATFAAAGKRVALWGIGSKGVTFLNSVPGAEAVGCTVDLNPRKHGRHVPGTGHRVVGPEDAARYKPDVIVAMNPLYLAEIGRIAEDVGMSSAEVIAVDSLPGHSAEA